MTGFAFACPDILAAQGFLLRLETPADQEQLRKIYIQHRWSEFAQLPCGDDQKYALLAGQYAIQHRQYLARYTNPAFYVLEQNGVLAGRLMLGESGGYLVILDILIAANRRGQGIGSALLCGLRDQAAAARQPVLLHVDKTNPARRLYERLGFRITGDAEIAYAMAWVPGGVAVE